MNDSLGWIIFLAAVWLALRALLSLSIETRDRLHALLVEHYKNARLEQRKGMRIRELKIKIRNNRSKQPALGDAQNSTSSTANPTPPSKSESRAA